MNAAKLRTIRPTKPIPVWLTIPGLTLVVAWLRAGCSTMTPPAPEVATQDKAPARSGSRDSMVGSRSSMADRPDRRYIQPTPPSEQDLSDSAIIDVPNKRIAGAGEMMEPDREVVELPSERVELPILGKLRANESLIPDRLNRHQGQDRQREG